MKKTFAVLLMLLPALSNAQKLEFTLKGGIAPNTFPQSRGYGEAIEKPTTFCGSMSLTAGLPKKIRAGLSVSAYNLEYTSTGVDQATPGDVIRSNSYKYGNPIMPVEVMFLKRFDLNRFSFDAGLTGGMSVNRKMFWWDDNSRKLHEEKGTPKGTWYTYGLLLAGQVNISKHFAIGAETQVKRQHMGYNGSHKVFLFPVMLKASVRI